MNYNIKDSILVSGITNLNTKIIPILKKNNINIDDIKINGIYNHIYTDKFPLYKHYVSNFWIKFEYNSNETGHWVLFTPIRNREIKLYISPNTSSVLIKNGPNNDENWISTNNINLDLDSLDNLNINIKRITDLDENEFNFDIDFFIYDTIYVSFLKTIDKNNDFSYDPFSGVFKKNVNSDGKIIYKKINCQNYNIIKENDIWYFTYFNKNNMIKIFKALSDNDEVPLCYWIFNFDEINEKDMLYLKNVLNINLNKYSLIKTKNTSNIDIDMIIKELNTVTDKFINNILG